MLSKERYTIIEYDKSFEDIWDSYVDNSRNGTVFHKQKFLSYHPPERFPNRSLIVKRKGKIAALFPAAELKINGKRALYSHPGSSYGGLVVPFDFGLADAFASMSAIIEFAKGSAYDLIEIRHAERVFHKAPSEELDFALTFMGFEYSKRELSSTISLKYLSDKDVFDIMDYSSEKSIKKAIRGGLEFSITSEPKDFEVFYELLHDNLKNRHNTEPTHTFEEVIKLKKLLPEELLLCRASLKEKPLGFLLVFVCNTKAVHIFYTAQDFEFSREYRPINFIYYNLINWARGKGFSYINIGISTEEGGKRINWPLFNFKETLGGRGARRDSYRLDLNKTA